MSENAPPAAPVAPPALTPPRLASLRARDAAGSTARFADAERHRIRVVRLKIALPLIAVACVAAIFVSLVVNQRPEPVAGSASPGIEMDAPVLKGIGNNGKPFEVKATQAAQTRDGVIELTSVEASMELEDGLLTMRADSGRVQPETGAASVKGGVKIDLGGIYHFETESADADMKAGRVTGTSRVRVEGPMGTINAAGFTIEKSVRQVTFTGGVTSVLNPAAAETPPKDETPPATGTPKETTP